MKMKERRCPKFFENPASYRDKNNDWYGALLRTAPIQSYNLTVTTNKENVSTSLVAGVFKTTPSCLKTPAIRIL